MNCPRFLTLVLYVCALGACATSNTVQRKISSTELSTKASLDVHLHHNEINPYIRGQDIFLDGNYAAHAFLISEAWKISGWVPIDPRTQAPYPHYAFEGNYKLRDQLDALASDLVKQYPDQLSGLCGVRLNWADLGAHLTRCLNRPGMYGLKMRFDTGHLGGPVQSNEDKYPDDNNLLAAKNFMRLKTLLGPYKERRLIILMHINAIDDDLTPRYSRQDIQAEVDRIFQLVHAFPKFGFIIAHTGNSAETLAYLIKKDRDLKSPSNLFVEFSGHGTRWWPSKTPMGADIDFSSNDRAVAEIAMWRQFGIGRILFGTDYGGMPANRIERVPQELNMLTQQGLLQPDEVQKVFVENGVYFLKVYRPDLTVKP